LVLKCRLMMPWLSPASCATVAMVVSPRPRLAMQRMAASMSCCRRSSGAAVRRCVFGRALDRVGGGFGSGKQLFLYVPHTVRQGGILTASRRVSIHVMNEWLFSGNGRRPCFHGTLC